MDEKTTEELPGDGSGVLIELADGPFAGVKQTIKGDKLPPDFVFYGCRYYHNARDGKFHYDAPKLVPGIDCIEGVVTADEIQTALASFMLTKKVGIGMFNAEAIEITFERDTTKPGFVMFGAFVRVLVKTGVKNRG